MLVVSVLRLRYMYVLCSLRTDLRRPPSPTPILVFNLIFVVSLPLLKLVLQNNDGAHPCTLAAIAEMPEAETANCTALVYVCACPTCLRTPSHAHTSPPAPTSFRWVQAGLLLLNCYKESAFVALSTNKLKSDKDEPFS